MSKLTPFQKSIIKDMIKFKGKLQTSEGKDYKVWLVYGDGSKRSVRRDTANILFMNGYITIDERSKSRFFEYIYTGKTVL